METKNKRRFGKAMSALKPCWNCGAMMEYNKLLGLWICELCGATEDETE